MFFAFAPLQIAAAAAAVAFCIVLFAEKLHFRRIEAAVRLATGPTGDMRRWVRATPMVRAGALAAMAWSLTVLFFTSGGAVGLAGAEDQEIDLRRRMVFVADLSPSMHLEDAGPDGEQKRLERMHDVVDAILKRIDGDVLYGVVCFYTDAMPAIVDAEDSELVRNIFDGLPVWYVMEAGKTDLGLGIRESLETIRGNPEATTTVFICTDGDSLPLGTIPKPPASVRDVYVLGVGDPKKGTFIDDHMSRQDASVLTAVAGRLGGEYVDVNEKHLSTFSLGGLVGEGTKTPQRFGLVDVAIYLFVAGAVVHACLPVALGLFGSDWRTVRAPAAPKSNVPQT